MDSGFPTPAKLDVLRRMGVDAIIVHLNEYNQRGLGISTIEGLRSLGVKELMQTDSIIVFRLN
ncbi:MAG: hypothetical protein NT149_02350 [Candidatus Gottesmanbacteria bacterium]|nr:hypothetical protein [Candidatus Gottesmanbacteria bacterium]